MGRRGKREVRKRRKRRRERVLKWELFLAECDANFIRFVGCVETDCVGTVTLHATSCEAAVVTEFSDTVRAWTTLPALRRATQQLSQAKHQKHELSIVTCICRKSEGFLINGGALN